MKKNKLFEEMLAKIPPEVKRQTDLSFDLADLIYKTMPEKNITYNEIADQMGVSISEVERMTSGTYNFTISIIAKLETILGVKLISVENSNSTC